MPAKAGIQNTEMHWIPAYAGMTVLRPITRCMPNKVLAAEYQTMLPPEKLLVEELAKTRRALEARGLSNVENRE